MTNYRQHTGGEKEFRHPGFKLEDTNSSKDFKKSLYLSYFYKDPYDLTNIETLKKFNVKFNELKIKVPFKFSIKIYQNNKLILEEKEIINYNYQFPQNQYKIILTKKIFLLFKKSKTININLDKNKDIKITF